MYIPSCYSTGIDGKKKIIKEIIMSGNILIVKRDGKVEPFSLDKIKNAISRAFLSVGSFATQEILTDILGRLSIHNGMSVEEIEKRIGGIICGRRETSCK
mgnify:CR=1 FL=1